MGKACLKMRRSLVVVVLAVVGCRLPDSRTAVELEGEAERLRLEAETARAAVRTAETTRPVPSGSEAVADPGGPLAGYAQGRAGYVLSEAARYDAAAKRIRDDAQLACRGVPAAARRSCPLGSSLARLEALDRGVRLVYAERPETESLRAQIRCALAEARVDRPAVAESCPLLVPGANARVVEEVTVTYLEITGRGPEGALEIQRRASLLSTTALPAAPVAPTTAPPPGTVLPPPTAPPGE